MLIVYANIFENNSVLSANGMSGGNGYRAGGGGSGGGSINVFYNSINSVGSIQVNGGYGGSGYSAIPNECASGGRGRSWKL